MKWQEEVLLFDGDEYYSAVIKKINEAQTSIRFECYIFENDEVGQEILKSLAAAAQRKIKVYLMVDAIGSGAAIDELEKFCKTAGIHFKVFNPVRFRLDFFIAANKRNHRKVIILDSQSAFVGSFNVSNVHSAKYSGAKAWHDAAVFVKGPAVSDMETAFHIAWNRSLRNFKLQKRGHDTVLLNSDVRLRFSLYQRFNSRLLQAKEKILVTNAYFLPRRKEIRSLVKAAKKKVFVGLCLPKESDVWIVHAISRLFYRKLLKAGVRIFEYEKSILHSKTIIVDGWASVGSHNFNHRSFIHDLEIQVALTHEDNIQKLKKKWDEDTANSSEISLEHFPPISLWTRIVTTVAFWFRYWM